MDRKWIFADWRLPSERDLRLVQDLGFTDVVLGMVLPREPKFRPSFSTNKIVNAANDLTAIGVRVHIMAWVYRQKTFIKDCADWMVEICTVIGDSKL